MISNRALTALAIATTCVILTPRSSGGGACGGGSHIQEERMISNRCHMLGALVVALTLLATPAAAQYMYLDANGNGVHDSGDRLGPVGVPTTVDVWVVTDHNRDGSVVTCPQDAGTQMSLISYVVNLQAGGGTVSYGGFVTRIGTVPFGEFNPGDGVRYKNGFGLISPFPQGTYRLCTFTVTPVTGSPQLDIVDLVSGAEPPQNGGPEMTSFGSACFGNDFDNTYKLAGPNGGSDWTDVDGLAPYPGEVGPPVLAAIGNKTVNAGSCLTFTATATAPNGSPVTFFLSGAVPAGASITTGGLFQWCPTQAQAPGNYPVTICALDNVTQLTDCETIAVFVSQGEVGAPVLNPIGNKTVNEGELLTFTATAVTSGGGLAFFSLSGPIPLGASITSAGGFRWTPTEMQGGRDWPVTVCATDNGLTTCETFTITVPENNIAPVLSAIGNKTASVGVLLAFSVLATDADIPANVLTFTLDPGAPPGATVTAGGTFTWTPATVGTFLITVRVTDNGSPPLSDSETFTVTVGSTCRPPTANAGGPYSGVVGVAVSLNGGGSSDPDGDVLTYVWDFGDGTSGAGVAPMHAYGAVGSYSIALEVRDACNLSDGDITSATISNCLTAFFYAIGNKSAMFNLQAGKPTECLQIEPVLGAFMAEDVDLGSVVLRSAHTGSIDEVHALASKSSVGADRNGNGIDEITACFAKSDLRLLFSDLNATQTVEVTLEGNLVGGGKFCTTQGLSVKAVGGGGNLAASISPNPLNPSAVLTFTTHERGPVLVQLFDVRGRLLRTLRDEADAAAGYHDVRIDGTTENGARLSSGIYYVRIRAGLEEERKAITILK